MSNKATSTNRTRQAKVLKAIRYQGFLSRVAKELGVSRSHVYYVAIGERQSERVSAALAAEIDRIERDRAA